MSIFHDEETALTPKSDTSWSKGARTGPAENAAAAFKHFVYSEIFTSERNNLNEEYTFNIRDLEEIKTKSNK